MKPEILHNEAKQVVVKVGSFFGHIIILHDGEISAPKPKDLSPAYGPVK
jgi:hypothetical protein